MSENCAMPENKMGTMPILKLIINMSFPMMLSMLIMALYNIVDSIFVAKISEEALTAVSLAFPIQNLMISFGVGTGVGVNALLSMRLGQKNQDEVDRTAMNGIFLAIVTYCVFVVAGHFIVKPYFNSQTKNQNIIDYGVCYMNIITNLGIGSFLGVMFDRLLQATGKTYLAMISQIIGAIFNIVFDPLLIFGIGIFPKMGITGAALATVLGQILGLFISIFLNLKYNKEIHFKIKNIIPNTKVIGSIYKVGIPSIAMSSITTFVDYFVNLILGQFSMTAIAVFGVFIKVNSFVFMPVFGLNNGIVPIIAYNYGAQNKRRITNTIKGSLALAFCIMTFGFLIFEIFPGPIFDLFDASEEMRLMGIKAFRRIAPSFLGAAIAITLSSVFQAFGNAVYSLFVSFSRQAIVLLPVAFLLSKTGNVDNVWWAFVIAEFMSLLMSFIFLKRIYRKKISVIPAK